MPDDLYDAVETTPVLGCICGRARLSRGRGDRVPARGRSGRRSRAWCCLAGVFVSLACLLPAALPAGAAPSLFGEPGLMLTPTADPMPRGEYATGVNTVDEPFRGYPDSPYTTERPHATIMHYFSVGVLPAVDVTAGIMNIYGKLLVQYYDPNKKPLAIGPKGTRVGGWDMDRIFSLRVQVLRESEKWPGVAVGWRDATGTTIFGGKYAVASRHFRYLALSENDPKAGLGLHLGVGLGAKEMSSVNGLFGGVEYWPTGRVGVMLEKTPRDLNLGARVRLTEHLQVQPSLFDMRWLGGGISYTHHM